MPAILSALLSRDSFSEPVPFIPLNRAMLLFGVSWMRRPVLWDSFDYSWHCKDSRCLKVSSPISRVKLFGLKAILWILYAALVIPVWISSSMISKLQTYFHKSIVKLMERLRQLLHSDTTSLLFASQRLVEILRNSFEAKRVFSCTFQSSMWPVVAVKFALFSTL